MPQTALEPVTDPSDTYLPTLGELLALDELLAGDPEILTGLDRLGRVVRGVRGIHISEISAAADLVERDELVLTTSVALGDNLDYLESSVKTLVSSDAAGLVIKASPRFRDLPLALIDACAAAALPLVALRAEVSLVRIAEAMCSALMDGQLAVLQTAATADSTFTKLAVEGASATRIVNELAVMCGCPAVFENLRHQVLAYGAAQLPVEQLLYQWEARSRTMALAGIDPTSDRGWLDVPVELRGQALGRLIILPAGTATIGQQVALERAATALVLNQMLEYNNVTLERQAHRSAVADIIEHRFRSLAEIEARVGALGLPTHGRTFLPVLVEAAFGAGREVTLRETTAEVIAAAVRRIGTPSLMGTIENARAALLFSLGPADRPGRLLTRLSEELESRVRPGAGSRYLIATGPVADSLIEVGQCYGEADDVLSAARVAPDPKPYYDTHDIGIRGLLHVLRTDPHVQSFIERTLGPLLDYDYRNKLNLVDTLQAFLEHNGNKSIAADSTHVSRHTFYRRLATAQRILGVDLDRAEIRTSVHAAILALQTQWSTRSPRPAGLPDSARR